MKKYVLILIIISILRCSSNPVSIGKQSFDVEQSPKRTKGSSPQKAKVAKSFTKLSIDFLFTEDEKQESNELIRNLFAMEEDPEVVAERKRQEEESRKRAEEAAKMAEEERKKMEEELKKNPPPPKPPEITFDLIGYLGPMGKRIGVFKMKGSEEIILRGKDEKIEDDFIVVDIGYESAVIGFEGFNETKVIPLLSGGFK